jgi:hypothetical protein
MGAKAAKDAARMQVEGADRAAAQQREMFDIGRADLAPYREQGYRALSEIDRMMPYLTARVGQPMARQAPISQPPRTGGGFSPPMLGNQPVDISKLGTPLPGGALQPIAGSIVTDPQTGRQFRFGEPTDMSLDTTQAYERAVNAFQMPTMPQDMGGVPMEGATLLSEYLDPSMAFRMKYGTQATERLANVAGGALSGNTMRALQEFGQGLASTEYGNAFARAQSERQNIYNTLANIAGMGQGAVNTGVQAQQALGQSLAGLTTGAGAAQAAGTVGAANAYSQALQTPMNYLQLSSLLGRNPFGPVTPAGGLGGGAPTSSGVPYTSNLA